MAPSERKPLLDSRTSLDNGTTGDFATIPSHSKSNSKQDRQISVKTIIIFACLWSALLACYTFLFGNPHSLPDSIALFKASSPSKYTCLPGQSCWPTETDWSALNSSISGRLHLTVPWAAPCYADSTSHECAAIADSYGDGASRTAQYGTMQYLDWETCGTSQCALDSFNATAPTTGVCSLGRMSTYYVKVETSDDISKTLNFVRKHRLRLSIKNTGHDYFGRSSAANSLALWTHNLKDMKYHRTFQPKGCKTSHENIGEIGAGIQAQEAWEYFEQFGMYVTAGGVASVGLAGGFGQGGGHGPLGPTYGLMVDQAVEFEVVTADGQQRTINECSDPDLFWAMRGGGGGNYAVLTSYKFKLHPAVPMNVYSFYAKMNKPDNIIESKVHRDIIRALAANQITFAQHGIAGFNFILPDHVVSLQVMPSKDTNAIKEITSKWRNFLTDYPGLTIVKNEYLTFRKYTEYHTFTTSPHIARNGRVGLGVMEASRLIHKDLFTGPDSIEKLVDAVVTAMHTAGSVKGGGSAQLYATGPLTQPDNSKTGLNPAWRNSLWHVVMATGWTTKDSDHKRSLKQRTTSASVQPLKALTPGGGCYTNEGDWTEEDWQQTFFGDNYAPLLEVKKRYDPTGLFNCWKCVGWTGYDDPMYSCYSQSTAASFPSVPIM